MKFKLFINCLKFLSLCSIIHHQTVNGLESYRSIDPEFSDIERNIKQLETYLNSEDQFVQHRSRPVHRTHPFIDKLDSLEYKFHLKEDILGSLLGSPSLLDNRKGNILNDQLPYESHGSRSIKPEHSFVHSGWAANNKHRRVRLPIPTHRINNRIIFRTVDTPLGLNMHDWDDIENIHDENQREPISIESPQTENHDMDSSRIFHGTPEFTYKFDQDGIHDDEDVFAYKPNDPRYYYESNSISGNVQNPVIHDHVYDGHDDSAPRNSGSETKYPMNFDNSGLIREKFRANESTENLSFVNNDPIPEPQRRASGNPTVIYRQYAMDDNVYFIAIVAGCSTAAMFAIVLISLTWYRLQRGAKAAADIDYPAYGVTGPNKDVSPSGDQRLAQSAQMYHFQHQKQQIISMEKTRGSRDPGSISEAESDEENEEGDYTVYECPGLAPAAELEVKNPLFHDDPTPASPLQRSRD